MEECGDDKKGPLCRIFFSAGVVKNRILHEDSLGSTSVSQTKQNPREGWVQRS